MDSDLEQGGKAAHVRVGRTLFAPRQGFRIHGLQFFYEHLAWKEDEIKKNKNESPIPYTWSTWKSKKTDLIT